MNSLGLSWADLVTELDWSHRFIVQVSHYRYKQNNSALQYFFVVRHTLSRGPFASVAHQHIPTSFQFMFFFLQVFKYDTYLYCMYMWVPFIK